MLHSRIWHNITSYHITSHHITSYRIKYRYTLDADATATDTQPLTWFYWLVSQRYLKTSNHIISTAIELLPQRQYWMVEYSTVPCCTAVCCAILSSYWWHFVTGRCICEISRTVMDYSSSLRQQSTTTYSTNSQLGHTWLWTVRFLTSLLLQSPILLLSLLLL